MRELTRRHWMLLAASIAVQSCGGDGDSKGDSSSSGAGGSNFDRYSVTLPQSIAANETKVSIDNDEYLLDELPNGLGEVLPAVLLAHQGEDIVYFAMPSDNNQEVEVNSLSTAIGLLKHIPEIALLVKTDSNSDFALGQNSNVIALAQYIDNLIEEHGAAWMSPDNQELAEKIAITAKSVVKTLNSVSAAFSSGFQILNDDVSETHFARIEYDDFNSNGAIRSTYIEAQVLDDELAQFYQVQDFDREQDKLAVVISNGAYRHISVIVREDLSETGDVLDFTTLKPHVSQDNQFGESSEPTYGVFGGLLLSPGQFGQMVFNQEHLPDGIENGHYYIQAFGLGFHDTPLNRSEVKYAFEPVLIDSFNLFVEPLLGLYQKSKKLNQTNQTLQDINFDQLKLSDVYLTEETCNEIDKTKLQYEIVKSLIAKMNTLENVVAPTKTDSLTRHFKSSVLSR
ncbi:hypothetical protein HGP28_12010 [Vibrio sp. SM6]|uniref:Uncharacterized protein n=2 Tax=Vibrio agarilyticus TaxID=2726741 RepID=A0A7X8TRG0_9VIBR|nr:hypothetical protein [Vibrio agarilyticus]